MKTFSELGVTEPVLKAIEDAGFKEPSEIQEKATPFVLAGKNVIGGAATGSGKTLVFGAAIIKFVEAGQGMQALVLTPTRELAEQVTKALRKFSSHKPLKIDAVYGGVSINPQMHALKTADVVVGTPGRILDHLQRGTLDLSRAQILVLDEADKMFDMGFIDDVERIISQCPEERQTMLFSATITPEVSRIAQRYMRDAIEVEAEKQVDPRKLLQVYYDVQDNMKLSVLVHLLKNERTGLVMVFCNTRHTVDFVASNLKHAGIDALAIHGGFSQNKRNNTLEKFHAGKVYVIVCTDVAARGLDIQGVSHVYNYETPADSSQYVHRIGRTARAGSEGKAINLISQRDYENFDAVLRYQRVKVDKMQTPQVERIMARRVERPVRGFGRGRPQRQSQRGFGNNRRESGRSERPGYGGPRRRRPFRR